MPDALVTMECQRGVIGDLATFPALADAVGKAGLLAALGRLSAAAHDAGVLVAHATAEFRADRLGSPTNAPLLRQAARIEGQLVAGSPATQLVAELGDDPRDVVSCRRHGVSPFTGTDLDAVLRAAGTDTVVACGASLNVGLVGLCIEAVNLGYEVLLPVDATVAVPADYGEAMLAGTFRQLARLTTVDEVIERWAR